MRSEKSILNKIGLYDASSVWIFLVVYLVVMFFINTLSIWKFLPTLLVFCAVLSLVFFWRGKANAKRILNTTNSVFRSITEGGLIGAISFPLLVLALAWRLFFANNLIWNDSEIFNQTIYVLLLLLVFGFLTGMFGGLVLNKFNEKMIKNFKKL